MKLFISYSRDDGQWVFEMWRALQNEGHHDAWIDRKIVPATDWWATICQHIKDADCFIYVMSPKSVESIYCQGELDYALALNKPILPVMLKRCDFPQVLRKNRVQYQQVTPDMGMFQVLYKIGLGLTEVRVALLEGKYPPNDLPFPDVPSPERKPEHIFEVFAMAEEAAAANNITLAQEFYGQVIAADPDGLGEAAKERLDEIMRERDRATAYTNVKHMAETPALIKGARAAWRAFVRQYPGYDPDGLAAQLTAKPKPTPRPAAPPPPAPEPDPPAGTPSIASAPEPKQPRNLTAEELTRLTLDILPEPFAWIDIPGGKVTIERSGEFDVKPFMIAKYPVTNAQYAKFIDAGGYDNKRWWGNGLWAIRQEKGWTQPRYWQDSKWNGADHPVVTISWYEAVAFTRWLNHTVEAQFIAPTPDGTITLPTEMQWQRAAQGDDGREYPYGNTFDASHANTKNSGVGKTTPVTQYEGKGDSPYGVVDMSGNVWEWCLNSYVNPDQFGIDVSNTSRVVRGGSFPYLDLYSRAAFRFSYYPGYRYDYVGFRCVRGAPY